MKVFFNCSANLVAFQQHTKHAPTPQPSGNTELKKKIADFAYIMYLRTFFAAGFTGSISLLLVRAFEKLGVRRRDWQDYYSWFEAFEKLGVRRRDMASACRLCEHFIILLWQHAINHAKLRVVKVMLAVSSVRAARTNKPCTRRF